MFNVFEYEKRRDWEVLPTLKILVELTEKYIQVFSKYKQTDGYVDKRHTPYDERELRDMKILCGVLQNHMQSIKAAKENLKLKDNKSRLIFLQIMIEDRTIASNLNLLIKNRLEVSNG